jgi:two-component system sensor histidine kinase RegB
MFLVLLALSAVSLFSFFRKNISEKTLFVELIFDVIALTAQLYFSGGISNPFISLFLLQVIIGAILLKKIYAWLIAIFTAICYIWLSFYHQELHQCKLLSCLSLKEMNKKQ